MESKANEDYGKPFNRNTDWEKLSKIVEGEWNNSTPEGRKKIIINTHNGFMSGHEPEILKQWADVEESTKHWIMQKWDVAHNTFDQERKDFFDLTESIANENVASKMAYYYQKDAPKDWNDNQVSNEAEKILEETYGIKPKKEVVKEKAEESLSTVQQKIVDRKLDGVRNESIIHELKIWDNMSEEQAKKAVETTEIPLQDSIAHTYFSKKYAECNEN